MAQENQLVLSPLVVRQRISIGEILHVLSTGGATTVLAEEEIRVSPRITETLLKLDNSQSVIVSKRKLSSYPRSIDGVLRENQQGQLEWTWHRQRERLQREATEDWGRVKAAIDKTWVDAFRFRSEVEEPKGSTPGLRPAQIGALHAIGAHWSLYKQPGTIVMPTGTGKTETMIAALIAYVKGTLLVVVPSRVLREQTVGKFATLGLLRHLGVLLPAARNPIIGVVRSRPRSEADLAFLANCHVVVGTMAALGQGEAAAAFRQAFADRVSTLFVDEAHHIPAESWRTYREHFRDKRVLQFTATPFRRDGELVDGQVLYNYPLRTAQQDGYFKRIEFLPVFEVDPEQGDTAIAEAALGRLREDLAAGRNHLLMARCDNIGRATLIHELYLKLGPEYNPILVHSEISSGASDLDRLRSGQSRVVVCVDMLGEGFDLPQLKIAAMHDTHKSLGVLLQFTGRFTRAGDPAIGNATVVANIANQDVATALERLYSEDADWNHLLSEFSSEAVRQHFELIQFLRESRALGDEEERDEFREISPQLLRPKFSTVAYRANHFQPKLFYTGLAAESIVHRVWLHRESNTLYFVTRTEPLLQWTRSHDFTDRQWDLFILHYDTRRRLLYIYSSDKSSTHESLAKAVSGDEARLVYGDSVFRTLGKINRLQFQNIGLKKHGRRNLRYAMYTGADVEVALGLADRAGSEKSNLFGGGWEGGSPITIGCSYKGRVWSREQGTVLEFVKWAETIGAKLLDDSIDTATILKNVLIPKEIEELPDSPVLAIEWPIEMLHQTEERVILRSGEVELPISMFSIMADTTRETATRLKFTVEANSIKETLSLEVGGTEGFRVQHSAGDILFLKIGRQQPVALAAYFSDYPPLVKFVDMSELDGNLLVNPREAPRPVFPPERFEVWDWRDVDVTKESMWKGEEERLDSIQARAAHHFAKGGFEIVFDDDSPGEAGDLVCFKEEAEHIRLALVHCKFTTGDTAGRRVKDVVEVCSQAVRSAKWKWRFRELCRHVASRERRLKQPYRATRFLVGTTKVLNKMLAMSRFKEVRAEIVIVQPGLSRDHCTPEQSTVLAAAHSFLKQTVDTDLDVICSE